MNFLDKINSKHTFALSALFHVSLVLMVMGFLNSNGKINLVSEVSPVAIISGSEFEIIKSKMSKENKKIVDLQESKNGDVALNKVQVKESKKGRKDSKLKNGLDLDLAAKNAKNYDNSYASIIANKLEQNKIYISMAQAPSDIQTKVTLQVKLDKNGGLSSYKVVQNSNYTFFNRAAVKILELSAPFPAPPAELADSLEFTIPVLFDTV